MSCLHVSITDCKSFTHAHSHYVNQTMWTINIEDEHVPYFSSVPFSSFFLGGVGGERVNIPFSTACPNEHWRESGNSCATNGFSSFLMECFLVGRGGSKACELRLCCWCCSSNKGFVTVGNVSGVCLLVRDEERNELPNLDSVGVPRNPMLGDCTLLYKSIDCLKNWLNSNEYFKPNTQKMNKNNKYIHVGFHPLNKPLTVCIHMDYYSPVLSRFYISYSPIMYKLTICTVLFKKAGNFVEIKHHKTCSKASAIITYQCKLSSLNNFIYSFHSHGIYQ